MSDSAIDKNHRGRVLIVEDDREMCRFLSELLAEEGYEVATAVDGAQGLERFRQEPFDVTITDLRMPRMKGGELLRQIREIDPHAPVVVITAFGSIENAVEMVKEGAFHYLTKPFRTEEILLNVARAVEQRRLKREIDRLRRELADRYGPQNIVGRSRHIQHVREMIRSVSDLSANVLLTGESGTGKELVARAIHYQSSRARHPFVPFNCAAVPETLLESELFGYVRGAFTDARRDRRGLFQEASGGTLFLDEIGELAPALQVKLLRVLEDKEVRPLGANRAEKVDVRVIAATNGDLERLVEAGAFRRDLFYRLNVIHLELRPLRERPEDIPVLAQHFLRKFSGEAPHPKRGISDEALSTCSSGRSCSARTRSSRLRTCRRS
jgi:DNA-binding NtrC family response regulator